MFHITGTVDQSDPLADQLKAYSGHPIIEAAKESLRGAVRYGTFGGTFAYSIIGNDQAVTVTVGTNEALVSAIDAKVMGSAPEPEVIEGDAPDETPNPEVQKPSSSLEETELEAPETIHEEVNVPDEEPAAF